MKLNEKLINELAVKAAFHNQGWCPDTNFYELIEDGDGLTDVAEEAQKLLNEVGLQQWITKYDVAEILFGMDSDEVDSEE